MRVLKRFILRSTKHWQAALVFVLFCSLIFTVFLIFNLIMFDTKDLTAKRLNQTFNLMELYKRRHVVQRDIIYALQKKLELRYANKSTVIDVEPGLKRKGDDNNEMAAPTLQYEQLRRRVRNNIAEMWNYMNNKLGRIRKRVVPSFHDLEKEINSVLLLGAEHKNSLLSDIDRLQMVDGYDVWRQKEANDLNDLVQLRLRYLQNPKNCNKARKLVCYLTESCGFGCQLHDIVYYFINAYAKEHTLLLNSQDWNYHKGGWEAVFEPVSDTCRNIDVSNGSNWLYKPETLVVKDHWAMTPTQPYMPPAIPEDLAPRLMRLHGDPIVWWVGQFVNYLFRPQLSIREFLESEAGKLGWRNPIVGVQVRRTDKRLESAFYDIEEYMLHVEDYYRTLEINGTLMPRRVFIATDDASVIVEARKKYPQYKVLGNTKVARSAAVSTRYTEASLNGIILDIHLLSLSDYLVCTFSSQICRKAYEIMQTRYPDAAHRFKSLDDIYFFTGQKKHYVEAVVKHEPRNRDELQMVPGDLVDIHGNFWNGFSEGTNTRTNRRGRFPSFKVNDKIDTAKMPTYAMTKNLV